jgi:hypothetical protein
MAPLTDLRGEHGGPRKWAIRSGHPEGKDQFPGFMGIAGGSEKHSRIASPLGECDGTTRVFALRRASMK